MWYQRNCQFVRGWIMPTFRYLIDGRIEEIELDEAQLAANPNIATLLNRLASSNEAYERSFEKNPSFEKDHDKTPSHGNSFSKS